MNILKIISICKLAGIILIIIASVANAIELPQAADAGRFGTDRKQHKPPSTLDSLPSQPDNFFDTTQIPAAAKTIRFTLHKVNIEGATVFTPDELQVLYQQYLGKEISLDMVWQIASGITKYYQDRGYFLSQAFVPQQEISTNGVFLIKVVEGYAGSVELDQSVSNSNVVKALTNSLILNRPLNIKKLEAVLLQLNDLPGLSFRSVLQPLKGQEGAVKLVLLSKKEPGSGSLSFDNHNSMYLGPYEAVASYNTAFFPLHKTAISYATSTPNRKLRNYSISHDITILPGVILGIYGGATKSRPGYSLKNYEIFSNSANFGVSLSQQFIRRKQQNLTLKFKIEGRNIASDILNAPTTRDHIREAIVNVTFDSNDILQGHNYISASFTQGITAFDANVQNARYSSRTNVRPDYKKLELDLSRYQNLGRAFLMINSAALQMSSGALYSSSQFGYGGQNFGRAYDASEISGDKGMSAAIEMRYIALPIYNKFTITPFVFYDIGKVWSQSEISKARNSIGEGIKIEAGTNFAANFTIANPLMHGVNTPRYANKKGARYLLQVTYRF